MSLDDFSQNVGRPLDRPVASSDDPVGGPSIFSAMQEQLGLKLVGAKGRPVSWVDNVERPSEN
jgi:uncharacterized protein (TIGR03435 family)